MVPTRAIAAAPSAESDRLDDHYVAVAVGYLELSASSSHRGQALVTAAAVRRLFEPGQCIDKSEGAEVA